METGAARPESGFADLAVTELLRRLSIGHFLEGVGRIFPLNNPDGAEWIFGGVDNTIYKGKDAEVNGWGKFYLPNEVEMRVIGVIHGTSCPHEQLVLMICEDGALYAYDGEELHAVALNVDQLLDEGIKYPAAKSYYKGEAFKDMTKEHWAEVKKGAVGQRLEEEHRKLVTTHKSRFLEILKSTKQLKGAELPGASTDIRKKPAFQISQDKLAMVRRPFIDNVPSAVVCQLLDHLLALHILNVVEYDSVLEMSHHRRDMARNLFHMVRRKGQIETMLDRLKEIDTELYNLLGLP